MRDRSSAQREQLARTFDLMADAVEKALSADNPSASALEVGRKWLEANGATLDTVRSWRMNNGLGFDPSHLPKFDDSDDAEGGGAPAVPNPLRVVPPFAPTDTD